MRSGSVAGDLLDQLKLTETLEMTRPKKGLASVLGQHQAISYNTRLAVRQPQTDGRTVKHFRCFPFERNTLQLRGDSSTIAVP